MPKRRRNKRPEILNRTITITTFRTSLRVSVDDPRDPEPLIVLRVVCGMLSSAQKDRQEAARPRFVASRPDGQFAHPP
jgi:hypothetical protein